MPLGLGYITACWFGILMTEPHLYFWFSFVKMLVWMSFLETRENCVLEKIHVGAGQGLECDDLLFPASQI